MTYPCTVCRANQDPFSIRAEPGVSCPTYHRVTREIYRMDTVPLWVFLWCFYGCRSTAWCWMRTCCVHRLIEFVLSYLLSIMDRDGVQPCLSRRFRVLPLPVASVRWLLFVTKKRRRITGAGRGPRVRNWFRLIYAICLQRNWPGTGLRVCVHSLLLSGFPSLVLDGFAA
jgi:hypothetical protein